LATAALIGIVTFIQYFAYQWTAKWDMTSTGINSLSEASERLLKNLDAPIRLTSLYFRTDPEPEDQQNYRRAIDDLLGLYAATNRTKVTADWVSPPTDYEKFNELVARLQRIPDYQEELQTYKAHVDRYFNVFDSKMRQLLRDELERINQMGAGMENSVTQRGIAPVEDLLTRWGRKLDESHGQVEGWTALQNPDYGAAVEEIKTLYSTFTDSLNKIIGHGRAVLRDNPEVQEPQASFLRDVGARFAELLSQLTDESNELKELKPLRIEQVLRELEPDEHQGLPLGRNAILVETAQEARVVDFGSVWPPVDPNAGGRRLKFKDRAFKGEEKVTSAILRATHKEQTAVLFVRFGGAPLFLGGFIPGQPPAPYATMKQQLEEANFIVEEWDVKTSDTPPDIDPKPTKIIYVVLRPTPPERGPMGQPGQEPPISESQKKAVLDAIGPNGRAMFIAGWHPGPFGPIPFTYEYDSYLQKTWGLSVVKKNWGPKENTSDAPALLIQTASTGPGKYAVTRQDWFNMYECEVGDHEIVSGPQRRLVLPWCAPLEIPANPPEGVTYYPLVIHPKKDGVWGVKEIQAYVEQQQRDGFLRKAEGDLEGPFTLAVAATKGDAKAVVVSARDFATDQVAFAPEFAITSQGFTIRSRNPGNVTLFINSLHWLNDNTEFMNLGKPIDAAVLEIPKNSHVRAVRVLTIGVWPALALVLGGVTWWVRRK
jgi:hypothetical protein